MSFQNTTVLTNGLSDFHKMAITVFKFKFDKGTPNEIVYRDYKNFDNVSFNANLKMAVSNGSEDYGEFEDILLRTLNAHAPLKKKVIRANHAIYMTKSLRKAIMRRSQLQSKYYKTRHADDYEMFKKQLNFVSKMYKKEKKMFYKNLDIMKVLDNKTFWRYMKPVLSEKSKCSSRITLVNGPDIITEDAVLAETFSTFFKKAIENLQIKGNSSIINKVNLYVCTDPVDIAIEKYKDHPSILKIKQKIKTTQELNFLEISQKIVEDEIKKAGYKQSNTVSRYPS
jgi:hypothetical protein